VLVSSRLRDGSLSARKGLVLIVPALLICVVLFLGPLGFLIQESFRIFVPGRIAGAPGSFTFANYRDLLHSAYLGYFLDTFRLSLIATSIGVLIGYAIAYFIAMRRSGTLRLLCIAGLISMLFVGVVVRVYALALSLGPIGLLGPITRFFEIDSNNSALLEATVVAGLVHYIIPIAALTLMGAIQNINPRLSDAAQILGAPRWFAVLSIVVPLSLPGIISAFLLGYALAISSFVVPLILGRGIIFFATNLIYQRFSEVPNYPGGSAIAIVLLLTSLAVVYSALGLIRNRYVQ
jgi:ABC-type spermidine/putrescine transport system permease subunit I